MQKKKLWFKQVSDGRWAVSTAEEKVFAPLPEDIRKGVFTGTFSKPRYKLESETYIEFGEILFNTGVRDEEFNVKFEKGTRVRDLINQTEYRVGDDRYPNIFPLPIK